MGQEITLPDYVKVEIWDGFWTRQNAIDNSDKLFLFEDNILDKIIKYTPTKTQAVIRGLPNAYGICTKISRDKDTNSYYSDTPNQISRLANELNELRISLDWSTNKTIVLPKDGIGTGKAMLQQKAPKCWELLQEFLAPLYERAEKSVISES